MTLEGLRSLLESVGARADALATLGMSRVADRLRSNLRGQLGHASGERWIVLDPLRPHKVCPRTELEVWLHLSSRIAAALRDGRQVVRVRVTPSEPSLRPEALGEEAQALRRSLGQVFASQAFKDLAADYFWAIRPELSDRGLSLMLELWIELAGSGADPARAMAPLRGLRNATEGEASAIDEAALDALWAEPRWADLWGDCASAEGFALWAQSICDHRRFQIFGGEVRGRYAALERQAFELPPELANVTLDQERSQPVADWVAAFDEAFVCLRSPQARARSPKPVAALAKAGPTPEVIGERLRQARASRSLSRERLARLVGASATAIASWERGRTSPRADALAALCRALRVSADTLLFGESAPPDS